MKQDERERLVYHAKKALEFNWAGEYTQPGPRLYPHQWSWAWATRRRSGR